MTPSEYLKKNRNSLISEWEKIARERVKAAARANSLVLRDHVPSILDDLQAALAQMSSDEGARDAGSRSFTPTRSVEHGLHRASTEDYTVDQVILEFVILRHILSDRLTAESTADIATIETVARVLELAMLESCKAFSQALQQVQQKILGTLAHDIRTPLSITKSSLELLGAETLTPSETVEVARMAQRSIERSLGMLGELLDSISARAGEGIVMRFEETDYTAQVRETCEGIKLVFGDRIRTRLPNEPIHAVFCPSSIRRVLENLVSNAVKHGALGKPIDIALDDLGDQVQIRVHNDGDPIPPDEQSRIFEFLARATGSPHRPEKSWGIGLTLVKIVAEAHRGDVRIESAAGKGTTFMVSLDKRPRPAGHIRASLNPGGPR